VSPWPPRIIGRTSFTEQCSSSAMKRAKRALSSTPAMPTTRCFGKPETSFTTHVITSSGFVMTTTTASGACCLMPSAAALAISTFFFSRSIRSIPGLRGKPAVTTTTSAPRITSILSEPSMRASKWNTSPACPMSRALPAGTPGRMS
jgi:hypothetical protein